MDTKWKKSKSIIGFLAFLLGVSLLLEGALFFGTAMTSSNSRAWVYDSFKSDWRRTREFKNFVSNRLERLIMMGAGGNTPSSMRRKIRPSTSRYRRTKTSSTVWRRKGKSFTAIRTA